MISTKREGPQNFWWARVARVRFFWLLTALVAFILAAPAIPDSVAGEWEALGMVLVIFFISVYVSQGLTRIWAVIVLTLLLVISGSLDFVFSDSKRIETLLYFNVMLALIYMSVCVLSFVLRPGHVESEHIYGAICAYVLIAMAFATLDLMLEIARPGSFSGVHGLHNGDRPWWQFFYFSFTTLSTVGYGDIVPLTMRARSFVIIEQLIAVFYVAILIARLTGMYSVRPGGPKP